MGERGNSDISSLGCAFESFALVFGPDLGIWIYFYVENVN